MASAFKVTRRQLAAALAGSAVLLAQAPPPATPPAQTPQEDLKAALSDFQEASEQLGAFNLPMSTEPAFRFKA